MATWVNNSVPIPNPHGIASGEDIASLEKTVGTKLPVEYRNYLLEFNGGKFKNNYFERRGGIDGRVHSIFGLHAGPKYAQLMERWKLAECYDIGQAAPGVKDYLVFASTGTGDLLLLNLRNGEVFFLDHESIEDDPEYGARFNAVQIASSFDDFVESLLPANMIPDY